MRSMFSMGFGQNQFWMGNGGRGGGHPAGWYSSGRLWPYPPPPAEFPYPPVGAFAMGQTVAYGSIPSGTLTEDQRNQVYALLKDAVTKATESDTWIHAVGEDGQKAAMGNQFDTFRAYVNRSADMAEAAWPIYQRLGTDNQEEWWILDGDENKVVEFINNVNAAYALFAAKVKGAAAPKPAALKPNPAKPLPAPTAARPPQPGTAAASQPALPQAAGPAVSPLAIGVGAAAAAAVLFAVLS